LEFSANAYLAFSNSSFLSTLLVFVIFIGDLSVLDIFADWSIAVRLLAFDSYLKLKLPIIILFLGEVAFHAIFALNLSLLSFSSYSLSIFLIEADLFGAECFIDPTYYAEFN
jgi:hypothetical protein